MKNDDENDPLKRQEAFCFSFTYNFLLSFLLHQRLNFSEKCDILDYSTSQCSLHSGRSGISAHNRINAVGFLFRI
jgi:hypothetical protein